MHAAVHGIEVDTQTRCVHYHSALNVIAIKMKCCVTYYACKDCHDALAGHAIEVWPLSKRNISAVLCGVCGTEMSIQQYMDCANECPSCRAKFNPGCRRHHHFYFDITSEISD